MLSTPSPSVGNLADPERHFRQDIGPAFRAPDNWGTPRGPFADRLRHPPRISNVEGTFRSAPLPSTNPILAGRIHLDSCTFQSVRGQYRMWVLTILWRCIYHHSCVFNIRSDMRKAISLFLFCRKGDILGGFWNWNFDYKVEFLKFGKHNF